MKLNEYQEKAKNTDLVGIDPLHKVLGLAEEAGEVAGKFKKRLRGQLIDDSDIAAELGDVLWYLSAISDMLGYSLETIAWKNLAKLEDRKKRGVIKGEGDAR